MYCLVIGFSYVFLDIFIVGQTKQLEEFKNYLKQSITINIQYVIKEFVGILEEGEHLIVGVFTSFPHSKIRIEFREESLSLNTMVEEREYNPDIF